MFNNREPGKRILVFPFKKIKLLWKAMILIHNY